MKAFFQRLTDELASLPLRKQDFAMAVRCQDHECGYILKILKSRDEADSDNVHWLFARDFNDPAGYAAGLVEEFSTLRDGAAAQLEAEGKAPWPPLPAMAANPASPPVARIRALMEYARSLLPPGEDHLLIWAMFPLAIRHHADYARMMAEVVMHEFPNPWCHHMRLYLRDDTTRPLLFKEFADRHQARVRYFAPDLSQSAMEKSVEEEAADPGAPMEERMQNLLVLANLDLSHRRYADSLAKHDLLLGYYQATGNAPLTALALNGAGEVHERMGDSDKARELFLGALGAAVDSGAHPIMLNVALNLANLEMKAKQWDLAETHYATAHSLAAALLNPQVKIHALSNLGYCQYMQNRKTEAIANWEGGALLAKEMDEKELRKQCLNRLRDHYSLVMNQEKLSATQRELASVG